MQYTVYQYTVYHHSLQTLSIIFQGGNPVSIGITNLWQFEGPHQGLHLFACIETSVLMTDVWWWSWLFHQCPCPMTTWDTVLASIQREADAYKFKKWTPWFGVTTVKTPTDANLTVLGICKAVLGRKPSAKIILQHLHLSVFSETEWGQLQAYAWIIDLKICRSPMLLAPAEIPHEFAGFWHSSMTFLILSPQRILLHSTCQLEPLRTLSSKLPIPLYRWFDDLCKRWMKPDNACTMLCHAFYACHPASHIWGGSGTSSRVTAS